MRPDEADSARLWDMLAYAREISESLSESTYDHFQKDKNLLLATERRIEIIGEAARNISPHLQQEHPEIPWKKIIAQRHILAHEYGEIRHEMIFRVATTHIPNLIASLQPLIGDESDLT